MHSRTFAVTILSALLLAGSAAYADPPARGGGMGGEMTREQRAQMLRKIHTGFVIELGQMLDLDTAGTVKLADRLKKFDDQRVELRLDSHDAMDALRKAARDGGGDPVALAKRLAQNRVKLEQLNQSELDELLKGVPADKVAKVAVFIAEYPRRVERLAREIHRERSMRDHGPSGE